MTEEEAGPWFTFTIRDTESDGVEVPKLSRFLEKLSSTFYAIARAQIGTQGSRPGPRTAAEDTLAAIRLVRIEPGSTVIELAPPHAASQGQLPTKDRVTPDDVAFEFFEEVQRIEAGEGALEGRWDIRQRVREVVQDAGEIGAQAEIVYRPLFPRPSAPAVATLRTTFQTREIADEEPRERSTRARRISGHAFMVDVEPGRQRLRVKMPDGRDVTLDVDEDLIGGIPAALDQVVEIEVEEELEGEVTTSRVARSLEILPSSGPGSDQPPKSIEELEREQNLPRERPDYQALASAVWETEAEVAEFEEHLREMRPAELS